ncbi:TrkA C-terminal domain-containing protein, partial [Vibrio sp. 404]|nr:TrkA C-terminal domain-containing protein [Vibrio marinisediminis]
FVEAVVPDTARIVGRSAEAIGLAWRRRTVLMGIARQGTRISRQVRKTEVAPGDILLLLVPSEAKDEVLDWLGVLPLAD